MASAGDASATGATGLQRLAADLPHPRDLLKPSWRGWLHAVMTPVALVMGAVLVAVAETPAARVACTVYALGLVGLFGVSALYHRRTWAERSRTLLKRLDHSMIFVFIAASYTPFGVLVLHGATRVAVLAVVWGGAAVGISLRMVFLRAPRWLYTPLYLALGWVAIFVIVPILHGAGVAAVVLLGVGGVAYSLGGAAYASRWPDPRPSTFGYHEVFHAATVVAAICHYIAVCFALATV